MDLKQFIRDVPDFPIPGILFRDITPLLQEVDAFRFVIDRFADISMELRARAVVGIESRGFIFGAPLACKLGLPFIPIRKPGKLPAERMAIEYALEYGTGQLDIHRDALTAGSSVVLVDDLLATGGTMEAAVKLVELAGAKTSLVLCVIELLGLKGREKLANYRVESLIQYP